MPKPTPEYLYSEKPTIDQLQMMDWQYIEQSDSFQMLCIFDLIG